MVRASSLFLLLLLVGSIASLAQGQNTQDALTLGVQAYRTGHLNEAIDYLKKAVAANPSSIDAYLYLGMAYGSQVVPGIDTMDNMRIAQDSMAQFQKVLGLNPNLEQKISALNGTAALYFYIGDLDRAKEYQQKVVEADPKNFEAYYTIGVIDWIQVYKPRMVARAKLGLYADEPLIGSACSQIHAANGDKVKEGIEMLDKALKLRPDSADAMAYMNLMYRERADMQCGDAAAHEADLKKADEWAGLSLASKKRKTEPSVPTGWWVTPPPPPPLPKR